MYLLDEKGQITINEIHITVSRKNKKYTALEFIYSWRREKDLNRFMRFADRYAKKYGLSYERAKSYSTT